MRLQLDSSVLRPADTGAPAPVGGSSTSSSSRASQSGGPGDSIGISQTSVALNRLASDRSERIQQLAAAVRGGTYQVSSAAISNAILTQAGA